MKLQRLIKQNIPNTITCLNLFCGCMAIVFAFNYGDTFGALKGYELSFVFIGLAAVFDFCDGLSARLLHAYSALGKELDSLSDLVSFGVAPAALVYNAMTVNGAGWLSCAAFLIAVLGGLRLAKFNVDDRQTTSFIGLPIPSNAIFWIGMVAWINQYFYPGDIVIIALIALISFMMVSNVSMFSLKVKSLAWKGNAQRYILILATVAGVATLGVTAFAYAIILYILMSLFAAKNEQ